MTLHHVFFYVFYVEWAKKWLGVPCRVGKKAAQGFPEQGLEIDQNT